MANDDQGEWLNVTRAAHRLGWPRERLRSLVRRGKLPTMRSNTGELLVFITPGFGGQEVAGYSQPDWLAEASPAHPASQPPGQPEEVAKLHDEVEQLRATVLALTERTARAEGENTALRAALEREQARGDRLEARLAQPWWRRWLKG